MAIDQLSLYNNALALIGERKLASLTENREPRHKLDTLWDLGAVEYCLDLVKPHWATSVAKLTSGATSASHGYAEVHSFPANYLSFVSAFSDDALEQPINRYFIEDRTVATDYATVYLRYVKNDPATTFTNWTPSFAQLVAQYLAERLAPTTAPAKAEVTTSNYEKALKAAIQLEGFKEPSARSQQSTNTVTAPWLKIYNDALLILGLPPMTNVEDDSQARAILDVALNNDLVLDLMEGFSWSFTSTTTKITYDPSLEPDWGYRYVFNKPDELVRLLGVFGDEYKGQPLRYYDDEGDNLYCEQQTLYLSYVSTTELTAPLVWPASFRKLVAAKLALDAAPSIHGSNHQNAEYVFAERNKAARNSDSMQSPPQRIAQGSWVRSRSSNFSRTNGRGRP